MNPSCPPKLTGMALRLYWLMLDSCVRCDEREAHRINRECFGPDAFMNVGHGAGCTCWGQRP